MWPLGKSVGKAFTPIAIPRVTAASLRSDLLDIVFHDSIAITEGRAPCFDFIEE